MNTISTIRTLLRGALLAACVPALALPALAATAGGTKAITTAHPPATLVAKDGPAHSGQTMPAALRPAFYQALAKDAGATYNINKRGCAVLPKQTLKGCFGADGAHFTLPAAKAGSTTLARSAVSPLSLHLVAWGRGNDLATVASVRPEITGNQASYRHGAMIEWWRVLPIGFEQGFTIAKPPSGEGELTLALAASGQDVALPTPGAPSIRHSRAGGNPVRTSPSIPLRSEGGKEIAWGNLRYGGLVVTDANGKVVPATLTSKGDRILIAVNDAHAVYPLTVDPLVRLEQKVTASNGAGVQWFGNAVAVSGTTALIGADQATVNGKGGAAYVFTESNGTWTQTQELTASDGAPNDNFGSSVALDGTTVLVGAYGATVNGNFGQGAVYVFGLSDGIWTQTQKLTAGDGAQFDNFGFSVALDGSTAVVGADYATVNGNYAQGATYVFDGSNGTWTQTQKLTASDGAASDYFGDSVALDGTTALVGAEGVNLNGYGYVGAAYVFDGSNGTWTQAQKLIASDWTGGDWFGISVALSGGVALVGAQFAAVNDDQPGAAYVFDDAGGTWTQTQKLTASDGAGYDTFGSSVALQGTTAVIGAPCATYDPNSGCGAGAAYVFDDAGGTWTQTQKLTASDGTALDQFGSSTAVDGTLALVGAFTASINGNSQQGAVYFEGQSDLGLTVSAPQTVGQGENYTSQTIATNSASATSPAVTATIAVPAAASFVSATATQGSCNEAAGVVSCNFGAIDGNAGTATANVTLKATGNVGDTIQNVAGIAKATPPLTASAPTTITAGGACPDGYTEFDGTLAPGHRAWSPPYQASAGQENAILTAPAGFQLFAVLKDSSYQWTVYRIPNNEVHRWGPATTYRWLVQATTASAGGDYTLCILHP